MKPKRITQCLAAVVALATLVCIIAGHHPEEHLMKRRFYLSGPMRGYDKFNFPAFDRSALIGRGLGHGVMSPADMDRELGHTENDSLESINTPEHQRRFATRDCAAILALKSENDDGIALLDGWEKSTGGTAEVFLSRWLSLKAVDGQTYAPLTQEQLDKLDLTPLLQNLRRYLGDKHADTYHEIGPRDCADPFPDPSL